MNAVKIVNSDFRYKDIYHGCIKNGEMNKEKGSLYSKGKSIETQ